MATTCVVLCAVLYLLLQFLPVVRAAYEEDITVVEDMQSSNDELKHNL